MKILLISDTHSNTGAINEVITAHPDADIILHAGDGAMDMRRAQRQSMGFVSVKGNCDRYGCDDEEEITIQTGGVRIFLTHGHKYSVKSTKDLLLARGLQERADIICFGHTHIIHKNLTNGILMLNPGSLGYDGSYMVIYTGEEISAEIHKI